MGQLEKIWLKRAHRGPMDAVSQATLIAGQGLENSVDRSRRRQVTLLESEAWNTCMREAGSSADPSRRRANLLVSGLSLAHTRNRIIVIGDARLVIGGELTPCERMDEVIHGLRSIMRTEWRGGVFAQVERGGIIHVGDTAEWE